MNTTKTTFKNLGLCIVLTAMSQAMATAQNTTYFYINNETGIDADAIYFNLTNTGSSPDVIAGNGSGGTQSLAAQGYYSLAQLTGALPGSSTLTDVPWVGVNTYSGRFFLTLGQPNPNNNIQAPPPSSLVQALVESTISGNSNGNNVDVSYVDGISMPVTLSIKYLSTATNNTDINNGPTSGNATPNGDIIFPTVNPIATTSGTSIFTALTASTTVTPTTVRQYTDYQVMGTAGTTGTISGLSFVTSASNPNAPPPGVNSYHTWDTLSTDLGPTLAGSNTTIQVASYLVPTYPTTPNGKYPDANVGYVGGGGTSPFGSVNDPSDLFNQTQTYNLTASFSSNINPGGTNTSIPFSGQGVTLTGTGGSVGNLAIYISQASLDAQSGVYGGAPTYTIAWNQTGAIGSAGTLYATTNGTNSLTDRIVGDLSMMMDYGAAGSTANIQAIANGNAALKALLAGTVFDPTSSAYINTANIGQLTSGEYLYLLSLQKTGQQLAAWTGGAIQGNANFYDTYGNAFASLTDAYTYAYSDRLIGALSPDLSYNPAGGLGSDVGLENMYVEVDLLPGDYTYTVPEPSAFWLMPILLGGLGLIRLARSRRTA